MDFDQYVAARYGRLIEHAVLLGCAEGEAGTLVDQVLLAQRKRIQRAEDPDPLVQEALEQLIHGAPPRRSRTGPVVGIALAGVAVAAAVAAGWRTVSDGDDLLIRPLADGGPGFVEVLADRLPALADVVGTNLVSFGVQTAAGTARPLLIVAAAIDNLVKGAAGQAVQNLNAMYGRDEREGLQ